MGGKKEFGLEQQHVPKMNIIIATPGRLLQHLEQTAGFDVDRVCVLVLDEGMGYFVVVVLASTCRIFSYFCSLYRPMLQLKLCSADRILDMGFRDQMVRILDYLPPGNTIDNCGENDNDDIETPGRQTMLFSATQTKRVADLAALSLFRPEYLGVHDKEASKTPVGLEQSVMTVPLHHKLNAIYSFIKSHLKCKTIIFFTSCSQVRHAWQIFCTLQPGIPLMAIHGKLKQETRTKLYFDFLQRPHAVLFATDVAARGLDFPNVDWVVQADAPEDVAMYIHRVGRTARYSSGGKALLLVLPQEQPGVLKGLEEAKITFKTCSMNPNKAVLVTKKASAVVAASADMNLLAKKAFKSYLRSIHLMPNKDLIFPSVSELPLEEYALSLGLAAMPTVRFLKKLINREEERKKKNVDYKLLQLKEEIKAERLLGKLERLGQRGGSKETDEKILKTVRDKKRARDDETDSESETDGDKNDGGLLVVKKVHDWGEKPSQPLPQINLNQASKSRHAKKIRIDGSSTGTNHRIIFNDFGEIDEEDITIPESIASRAATTIDDNSKRLIRARDEYLESVRNRLCKTNELDQKEERERIQDKHRKRKMKEKGEGNSCEGEGRDDTAVTLRGHTDDEIIDIDSEVKSEDSGAFDENHESNSDYNSDDEAFDVKAQETLALHLIGM